MCGICTSVTFLTPNSAVLHPFQEKGRMHLKELLKRRGPDSFNEVTSRYKDNFHLYFCSSVLHLRGSAITVQPITDGKENVFLWNGEIFAGPLIEAETNSCDKVSDTAVIAEKLFRSQTAHDVLQILNSVKGPFAFMFYQASGLIWFGRDIFGRRSLLWNFKDSLFQLSSLAVDSHEENWEEVPTTGIFCLDLNESIQKQTFVINHYSWSTSASGSALKNIEFATTTIAVIKHMQDPRIQISVMQPLNKNVPSDTSLLDVMTDVKNSKLSKPEIFKKLFEIPVLKETVDDFEAILSDAMRIRIEHQLSVCKNCYSMYKSNTLLVCSHSYSGILFSGGLDSIVIACLADKYVDPKNSIDLLNVAFANKNSENEAKFNTPDRITGRDGFQALRNISPGRKWNLVEVNIVDTELNIKRGQHISELLYPSCTVLDDSIGCALWFASQGQGFVLDSHDSVPYKSPARVLLVGMGADEQLAGYSRHRAKFKNSGWPGLIEEISLEIDRIGSRNLGRDDRIIADSGVESRYPFLDENVVSFLNSLPIWLKANLNFERGIGEKLLLRLLAYKLGLTEAAILPKRAIQFGSRIAKLENSKEKGSDVCTRLLSS